MKRISNFIIHWFNGLTALEGRNEFMEGWEEGESQCIAEAYEYAKELNGCSAEEWCDRMFKYLRNKYYEINEG